MGSLDNGQNNLKFNRALEVGCGKGYLTDDILKNKYAKVDMFDKKREHINRLKRKFQLNRKNIQPTVATMENFTWKNKYDGIFIHWTINYPPREKAIKFLKECK